jgi:hypothetical protein
MPRPHSTAALLAAVIVLFALAQANAQTATIADGNSTAHFDLSSAGVGMDAWTVNGVNQLGEYSLWYRLGSSGPAQRINALGLTAYGTPAPNRLDTVYTGAGFRIDVDWTVFGSSPGFGQSDIAALIRITNTSQSPLDFHFWQYVDFNLLGTPLDTSVAVTGGNTATQHDGVAAVAETADLPFPSRYDANYRATVLANVSAGNLANNASQSNGDLAWAFQWDQQIAAGASLIINKDSNLTIPEPSALTLLGVGALCLLGVGRRRWLL